MGHAGAEDDRALRFRAIFDACYDFAWRALRRLGVHEAAVDDAAQELFLLIARKIDEIEPGKERSFVYGSARRIAADARRARKRAPTLVSDEALSAHADRGGSPEDAAVKREARAILDEALDTMPEDERDVFLLFELEGLSKSEVAQTLEIPEGTVASRLRRARTRFLSVAPREVAR